jgi:hypothetical protein
MHDPLLVRRGEPGTQLSRDLESLVRRQTADAAQERSEILAIHVLHRQEVAPLQLSHVVHAAHVWVRHLPRQANLGEESVAPAGIFGESLRQELQSHHLAELDVVSPVDFAHASPPDEADDAVAIRQHRPRRESAGVDRFGVDEAADER